MGILKSSLLVGLLSRGGGGGTRFLLFFLGGGVKTNGLHFGAPKVILLLAISPCDSFASLFWQIHLDNAQQRILVEVVGLAVGDMAPRFSGPNHVKSIFETTIHLWGIMGK